MKSLFLLVILFSTISFSQSDSSILKIFYDCSNCDVTFMKQNLSYVEFVRDRKFADVHLLNTFQQNGSGGEMVTTQFIGIGKYEKLSDTLSYSTNPDMTDDDIRRLQLRYVELGLMRFLIEKGLDSKIKLEYTKSEITVEEELADPWQNWVFRLSGSGWFNGQETSSNSNVNASVSARRVTAKNKFNLWSNLNQNWSKYTYDTTEIKTFQKNMNLYVSDVIAINEHWSYGIFSDAKNSIFSNYKVSAGARAAIEYNLFPYSESATKQAVAYYTVGTRYNDYFDTTLYNKSNEVLFEHSFLIGTSITQKWGSLTGSIKYQNFLHDFGLNAIDFDLNFNVRLFKGLSWRINGRYAIQHNQINIRKPEGQNEIDLFLSQKQFKSGYNYWFNTGLTYSFGSIYNTIVNPRFDF
jgi:hypothetical protein